MSANITEAFEHIIRNQSTLELLPFLLALDKKDIIPVREKTKLLVKEFDEITEFEPGSWKSIITDEQHIMLFLAGIKTYSRKEVSGRIWYFVTQYLTAGHYAALWLILENTRPVWLFDWLLRWSDDKNSGQPDYSFLRELEKRELLAYQPQLFVLSLPNVIGSIGTQMSESGNIPDNAAAAIAEEIRQDSTLINRDLMQVFDFESNINNSQARVQLKMPYEDSFNNRDENGLYPWQVWEKKHPTQTVTWLDVLKQLTDQGHLNRTDLLSRCLLALRRDFRRPLLTWFKQVILALKPTMTERLMLQNELVELLAQPLAQVVNFAIDQLKVIWTLPGFEPVYLLRYSDNLVLRPDLKSSLCTLLAGLAKIAQKHPEHAFAVARLHGAALAHADSRVQENAADGLSEILLAPQPLLSPPETAEIIALIGQADGLMGTLARAKLTPWLTISAPAISTETNVYYTVNHHFVPDISPNTAIVPVADWHELLFLTGQALKHDDPAANERWLDGLLRLQEQIPMGFAEQLLPYTKRFAQVETDLPSFLQGGHTGLARTLLLSWASDFTPLLLSDVHVGYWLKEYTNQRESPFARIPLLALDQQRYVAAEALLASKTALPLLSTPTHSPFWIAPNILVDKLLIYQAANTEPHVADLVAAIARTAHSHPATTAEALALLPNLRHAGLRELLNWFLGPVETPLPEPTAAHLTNSPPRQPAGFNSTLVEALPELWAVAARTKAPTGVFATLPNWLGYDYAGVSTPVSQEMNLVQENGNTYLQRWTDEPNDDDEAHVATEQLDTQEAEIFAKHNAPSPLLLYAPTNRDRHEMHWSWEHDILLMLLSGDLQFYTALTPNYQAPTCAYILRSAAWADNLESSERDVMAEALRVLLLPGPAYDLATTGVVASGLIHHTALCRGLGQEVVLQAVAGRRLAPNILGQLIGEQLAAGFVPVPRLAGSLALLSGLDALTDNALGQVLDALLPELPAAPPRNLRKLLELYADLLGRHPRALPAAVLNRLREWQATTTFNKLIVSLLSSRA